MRRLATPGWIASHLFAAAMVVLMANLGFWQLRRLDERRAHNETTAAAMAQSPAGVADLLSAPRPPPDYTAVVATGEYLAGAEVLIANRSSGGQPGSWLATPLRLGGGSVVAVVRGWVPRRSLAGLDRRGWAPPQGTVTVEGLTFRSLSGGRTAVTDPDETPEISRMDLDRYREASQVDVAEFWVRLRSQTPPQPEGLPVPVPDPDLGGGPHLSYAFQWFFFSAGAVVVYALILRRAASGADEPAG